MAVQLLESTTNFFHFRLMFSIRDLPDSLRLHLVLFCQLMFGSDMMVPVVKSGSSSSSSSSSSNNNHDDNNVFSDVVRQSADKSNSSFIRIPFDQVQKRLNQEIISNSCRVGSGGDSFTVAYFSELLGFYMMVEQAKYDMKCVSLPFFFATHSPPPLFHSVSLDRLWKWMLDIVFLTDFTIERIQSVASNLLTDLSEESRQGGSVVAALAVLATSPDKASNDLMVSIFRQRAFLKRILMQIRNRDFRNVLEPFNRLRLYLVSDLRRALVQVAYPMQAEDRARSMLDSFVEQWRLRCANSSLNNLAAAVPSTAAASTTSSRNQKQQGSPQLKRKRLDSDQFQGTLESFLESIRNEAARVLHVERNVIVAIGGVETSFLQQYVRCPVKKSDDDCYAVMLLCEILSSQEGPLFSQIRGRGLAYDCRIEFQLMLGYLCFSLYESSEPVQATSIFHDILRRLDSVDGEAEWLNAFLIETAQASLTYHFYSMMSTPAQVIFGALRSLSFGYRSAEQEFLDFQRMRLVTKEDIKRVYRKYFTAFLDPQR
jgi:Zn-dependent M16 (insulinase) family peptidase